MENLKPNMISNLQAGFRKTGNFPLDPEPVFSRLPGTNESIGTSVSEVFINHLQETRNGVEEETSAPRRKRRRLEVAPDKSIQGSNENQNLDTNTSRPTSISEEERIEDQAGVDAGPVESEEEQVEHELHLDVPVVKSRHRRASARAASQLLLDEIADKSSEEDISVSGSDPEWDS